MQKLAKYQSWRLAFAGDVLVLFAHVIGKMEKLITQVARSSKIRIGGKTFDSNGDIVLEMAENRVICSECIVNRICLFPRMTRIDPWCHIMPFGIK